MSNLPSLRKFKHIHNSSKKDGLRAGQRFCNLFLKNATTIPGLFNEADENKAFEVIHNWLAMNQYITELPLIYVPHIPYDAQHGLQTAA